MMHRAWSIVLASHLCTCVLHRQESQLHTLKLPKFFHFHGDFHQKWHFAHPKISFAHPELPFLAKSMAWSSTEEVPYCFSRSYVKLQGHTALKIVDFDPNWAFPDCNSSLESPMATKWCTKLEVALKRCPIVFKGHPSNFKVTQL